MAGVAVEIFVEENAVAPGRIALEAGMWAERRPAPLLIHHDLNVVERILRDQLTSSFKSIWVDNEEIYESVLRFVQRFQPLLVSRVKLYTRPTPIFDEFNITSELEKALRPKIERYQRQGVSGPADRYA